MQFVPLVLTGELGCGDELDNQLLAGGLASRTTFHRVVVGQRDGAEATPMRMASQLLRSVRPVRKIGVEMEVSVQIHFTIRAGRINSAFTLSRIPFTNLPLSWVENFFATSTASLMLTTGGISSR